MTDGEELCFMVALFGTRVAADEIVPLVGDAVEFLEAARHPLSHLLVYGRGFGERPLQFKRAWKRLCKAAPEDLEAVGALSFVDGGESPISDFAVTLLVDPEASYVQVGASLEVMPDAERQIVALVRQMLAGIRPVYGIGFIRKRALGPSMYGMGVAYGKELSLWGPGRAVVSAINRWGRRGMREAVYTQGILRDVYPYNLLSPCHLERDVGGYSLQDWITADSHRGQIHAWPEGLSLWVVEHAQVDAVRSALAPTGILFAYQD